MKTHSSFPQYLNVNSLYAWAICQKLPVKNFNWCKDLRYVNQKFLKNCDENSSEKEYMLEVDVEYPKKIQDELSDIHFHLKRLKLINKQNLHSIFMIRQDMWFILNC